MDNNETMLLTKQLFGPEYSTFLWNVIHTNWKSKSLVGTDDSTKSIYGIEKKLVDKPHLLLGFVVRYVTRYVVEVVSHVNDKMLHARLSDWLRFLRVCYRNQLDVLHSSICFFLLLLTLFYCPPLKPTGVLVVFGRSCKRGKRDLCSLPTACRSTQADQALP